MDGDPLLKWMEFWENFKKKHITGYHFLPPFICLRKIKMSKRIIKDKSYSNQKTNDQSWEPNHLKTGDFFVTFGVLCSSCFDYLNI